MNTKLAKLAVKTIRTKAGKIVAVDKNVQTILGVLRTIPTLRTTGSCGGHKRRHGVWYECSQKYGHWFVSFRARRDMLDLLKKFAETNNIKFDKGPTHKLPLCGVCDSPKEKTWYGFWGTNDPRRVAGKLQRFLLAHQIGG